MAGDAIDVVRNGGLGDVLMCTPALRALKRAQPRRAIRFYTFWDEAVRGLPYIDEVLPTGMAPPGATHLSYEDTIPPYAHIACVFGDRLGVDVRDVRPDCVVDPERVARFRGAWRHLPRPHVVVSRRASRWTPNKDWPDPYWTDLVARLTRHATVIEIGDAPVSTPADGFGAAHIDLTGRTSLANMVAAVAAGDLHVGPVSAPVHVAAAAHKPSVVVAGGYERPRCTFYAGNVALYTPVACAPCWLREPCPFDRKCLQAITPEAVEDAVRSIYPEAARPTARQGWRHRGPAVPQGPAA